jgi:tRNA-uridine 2-sulfurtransferase
MNTFDALSLFSGGLDSILATKLMQSHGHKVLGLHFVSPFFGKPDKVAFWEREYDIPVEVIDVGQEFVDLMAAFPPHGFGKVLNPCVDCKILMLRRAKNLLPVYGASYIISGEVLGQRPMSQRADTLNIIRNEADVRDVLLRPLSAGVLPVTPMEESGLVDRTRLPSLVGRGRKGQYALARELGVTKIPTQAGGCRLGERESARRYWPILRAFPRPLAPYFDLANVGRQLWRREGEQWMVMGRDHKDNQKLLRLVSPEHYVFELKNFPGPHAVGIPVPGQDWEQAILNEAAACLASYSPKARNHGEAVDVSVIRHHEERIVSVRPDMPHAFEDNPLWHQTRTQQKAWERDLGKG